METRSNLQDQTVFCHLISQVKPSNVRPSNCVILTTEFKMNPDDKHYYEQIDVILSLIEAKAKSIFVFPKPDAQPNLFSYLNIA